MVSITPSPVASCSHIFLLLVSLCFGRLLIAIIRVRKRTRSGAASWQQEHERALSEKYSTPYRQMPSFLPPLHTNFSGLSTSFISTIGTANLSHGADSSSSHHTTSVEHLPYKASDADIVSYAQSRPLMDEDFRDVRSPTPGSAHGLLFASGGSGKQIDSSSYTLTSPQSTYSQTPKAKVNHSGAPSPGSAYQTPQHQVIMIFEDLPRPSMGSYTSVSTFANAGGLIGNSATRNAIAIEVGASPGLPPSTKSNVQLSHSETRGAVIKIGGHLACCLVGYVGRFLLFFSLQRIVVLIDSFSCSFRLHGIKKGVVLSFPLPQIGQAVKPSASFRISTSRFINRTTRRRSRYPMLPFGGLLVSIRPTAHPYFVVSTFTRTSSTG